jgi:hypothetical protein
MRMTVEPDGVFTRDANLVTRQIADETIIVPIASGVTDLGSIFTLNDVGSTIWKLLEGPRTVGQIVAAVCAEYDVPEADARAHTCEFLSTLQSAGLARVVLPGEEGP